MVLGLTLSAGFDDRPHKSTSRLAVICMSSSIWLLHGTNCCCDAGSEKSLASLKLHSLQAYLPAEDIKRVAEQIMMSAVCQVPYRSNTDSSLSGLQKLKGN